MLFRFSKTFQDGVPGCLRLDVAPGGIGDNLNYPSQAPPLILVNNQGKFRPKRGGVNCKGRD